MKINNLIRKDLAEFKPYVANIVGNQIKLDANESPMFERKAQLSAITKWLSDEENLNIYPDTDSVELRKELASFWSVDINNIICGVGSDQIIDYITKVFIDKGDTVVTLSPTFSMYKITTLLNHGKVVEIPLEDDYTCNTDLIIETVNKTKAKILFLCTPNNPTGNIIPREQLVAILDKTDCVVVVDEAYAEFSQDTMITDINKYKNMIVLRTFSKAFGLAGARIGYGIGSQEIIDAINIVRPPFNLNTLSQLIGIYAIKNFDLTKRNIQNIIEERDNLFESLSQIKNIKVYKSDANFFFIESQKDIGCELEENNIIIRRFDSIKKNAVRISIGTKEENKKVLEIIKSMYQ